MEALAAELKAAEAVEARRALDPLRPAVVRLDGSLFGRYTADLERPYDPRFGALMRAVTRELVAATRAHLGYTQSDEISLCWLPGPLAAASGGRVGGYDYGGRVQKLASLNASRASVTFQRLARTHLPEKADVDAVFDARVFSLDRDALQGYFSWRVADSVRNSVSLLAHARLAGPLERVSLAERKERLRAVDSPWEATDDHFKYGTFYRRVSGRRGGVVAVDRTRLDEEVWTESARPPAAGDSSPPT